MGLNRVWIVVVTLILLKEWWSTNGCWEQERIALLQLKPFFNDPRFLKDWVDGEDNSDCCLWKRVKCNVTTGRVVHLYLSFTRDWESKEIYLNASLFLPFEKLEVLSLSENNIAGWVENEGFERLSTSLSNLRILDLSYNSFNNNVFSSLYRFSSLKSLYLAYNNFTGSFLNNEFNILRSLNELEGVVSLPRLINLDLSWNNFNNSILSFVDGLSSLKSLYLEGNKLKGSIQIKDGLCNLEELSISGNEVEKIVVPKEFNILLSLNELEGVGSLPRLMNLDLSGNNFNNSILSFLGGLSSLKSLGIGYNRLKGSIQIKDGLCNLEGLSISGNEVENIVVPKDKRCLSKLKVLLLDNIYTNKTILLQSLGSFPSLKSLYLRNPTFYFGEDNYIYEAMTNQDDQIVEGLFLDGWFLQINFLQSLGALTSFKNLFLRGSEIEGTLTAQDLPNFKNLESLDMTYTTLNNNFLHTMGEMNSLKVLWLSGCGLNGTLPAQGLCELIHLQELDISYNDFGGNLPRCLANLKSLQSLYLSDNQFTGNISVSPLQSLTSIQYLSLENNHFQIPISLEPFFNHSKLKYFNGHNNEIYAEIESHSLVPQFQLTSILLSSYGHGGVIPKFLYYQHDLQTVDLSHIHFEEEFPNWLLENNTGLCELYLANNSLSGPFQVPFFSLMNLSRLDISNNFLHGDIPTKFGAHLPRLEFLNMSKNGFKGSIPSSFGYMNALEVLDLSNNHLSGEIPEHLAMGCFSLQELVLSNNSLQGQIFSTNFNLLNLWRLLLDGNQFTGRIPDSLSNCSSLEDLDISNNTLSGRIPRWMGNMSNLNYITMPHNHLEGPIPMEFCQLDLVVIDLSENNISGRIPFCFSPVEIQQVRLSKNKLQGPLKDAFYNSPWIVTLDLSHNHFTGSIPDWFDKLSQLRYLLLNNNDLEGEIPIQLCQLDQISLIDLSHNNFSGGIPHCLKVTPFEEAYIDTLTPNFDPNGDATAPSPIVSVPPSMAPASYAAVAPTASPPTPLASFVAPTSQSTQEPVEFTTKNNSSQSTQEPVEFTTKNNSYSYQGRILTYMSGIDLSCNKLTGEIPHEIGNLSKIQVLNLSHNSLSGPIPPTFANLKQIESLDLSYNNLIGKIPPQLVELTFLSVFSVAHNNLSGEIPEAAQFATFEKSSYEENPLLCGTPLPKSCNPTESPSPMPRAATDSGEDSGFIDMDIFYVSFTVTYMIVLLAIAAVLYINPYWRRLWFYHIEMWITSCFYFVVDNLPKRFRPGNM